MGMLSLCSLPFPSHTHTSCHSTAHRCLEGGKWSAEDGLHVGGGVSYCTLGALGPRQQAELIPPPHTPTPTLGPRPIFCSKHRLDIPGAVWNISNCRCSKLPYTYVCAMATEPVTSPLLG